MTHSTFIDLRINNAEQFKESISEPTPNTKLYLTFGRVHPWANDADPTPSNTSISTIYEIWDNMIGGKKVVGSDMMHVIPRYNWTANTTYIAYDDLNSGLVCSNSQYYVMNSDYSIYKCLANNAGQPSTVEPTSISPYITSQTSDGYVWKYLYTLTDVEKLRFMTEDFIPVKTITTDDGSLQWQVQSETKPGAIETIFVSDGGTGYSNADSVVITITGDGTDAEAIATVNTSSNTVSSIVMIDTGIDYTWATITITDASGEGSGAQARAIISPPGGHGSNPLYELGGNRIIINTKIRYSENGILPVTNDFRQIALVKDPLKYAANTVLEDIAFSQVYTVLVAGSGDFIEDEWVYQGPNFNNATFKGRVVSWDSTLNTLTLVNVYGTPTASISLIGTTSLTVRSITNTTEGDLKKYSGRILYVDNIKPIIRSDDQVEDFKLSLVF